MLTRIVSILIALLVAWVVGPYLTDIFWFLPIKEIAEQINFRALLSKDASFYVGLLIWGFLLWKILEAGGLALLIAGPQRTGNIPAVRRAQGLLLNIVVLVLFALPVITVLAYTEFGRNRILDGIQRNSEPTEFLAAATADMRARLSEIEATRNNNATRQGALKVDGAVASVKDWWNGDSKYSQPITAEQQKLAQADQSLKEDQQQIQAKLSALTTAFQNDDPEAIALARTSLWEDIKDSRPWRLLILAIKYLWLPALPLAAILYWFLNWRAKLLLARICTPFLRCLDQIRMGLGGSSRFAGLWEELELHTFPGDSNDPQKDK